MDYLKNTIINGFEYLMTESLTIWQWALIIVAGLIVLVTLYWIIYGIMFLISRGFMMMKADIEFSSGNFRKGLATLEYLANDGSIYAQHALGKKFSDDKHVPLNFETAEAWFRMAAENGKADSQIRLAKIHYHGIGIDKDKMEAYIWFTFAINNVSGKKQVDVAYYLELLTEELSSDEIASAKLQIGKIYSSKDDQLFNDDLAEIYLTESAKAGNADAKKILEKRKQA